jgi:hypothetical protein
MKNLLAIADKADIHEFVMGQWKTDIFRNAHRDGGFVRDIVEQFAFVPRVFAEMTNDTMERAHFSTWWGVMMLRDDYDNPYIHDLYWLHEMYHAGHMPYVPNIGKVAFDEKMQRNELEASVLSEIQVYFELPELRALSFQHPIYADRFLADPIMRALWESNKAVAIETIRTIRRNVMVSKPEHDMDITEKWIRRFAEQNAIHAITWSDRYHEIEQHMTEFQFMAFADRDRALDFHCQWIENEAAEDEIDNIPFRQEAELFAEFYWANKAKYVKAMTA